MHESTGLFTPQRCSAGGFEPERTIRKKTLGLPTITEPLAPLQFLVSTEMQNARAKAPGHVRSLRGGSANLIVCLIKQLNLNMPLFHLPTAFFFPSLFETVSLSRFQGLLQSLHANLYSFCLFFFISSLVLTFVYLST